MKKISSVVASLVESTALYGGIKPASFWGLYQPRTPKINK